jgi:RimJ/RimL family protein N-acetyltransferase
MADVFEGRRVRLRALEPSDAELLFEHLRDTEISRRDARIQWPRSLAEIRRRLENPDAGPASDSRELVVETLAGQLVGGIDIQSADHRNGTFSVGIGLSDRSAWGRGYAKEAMLLALRHMFHERRYQKCNISVYAFNTRALGLYHRLGFQDEGRIRRNYFTNGEYHDEIFLGMTCDEFEQLYPDWHTALDDGQAAGEM